MLHDIDSVDWASLEHAYGEASDVPELLRMLLGDEARPEAIHALYGNIFHQSTRYPATPFAVPFLVELLDVPNARSEVLGLLTSCCAGWLSSTTGPYNADGPFDRPSPECDTDADIRRAIDAGAAKAIRQVRAFLDDDDIGLRARAATFLALFRTKAQEAELAPALRRRLEVEKQPQVRACLAFALGHVLPLGGADDDVMVQLHNGERGAARLMAAIMIARRMNERTPVTVLGTLGDVLAGAAGGDDVDALFTALPIHSDGAAGDAARALGLVGTDAQKALLPQMTARLRTVGGFDAVALLGAALAAAFGPAAEGTRPETPKVSELSPQQRELLVALVENDEGFWQVGNAMNVLMERGLASMREDLAEYLGVTFTRDEARENVRHAELMLGTFHDATRALEHVERALGFNPKLGRAHLVKGFALLEMECVEEAQESFAAAVDTSEGDDRMLARKNAAILLGQLGRRADGLALLEANVAERPSSSTAWYDLGLSLVKHGEHERCIDAIQRSLELEPGHANAHYTIACAQALLGRADDALQSVARALEIEPSLKASIRDDEDFVSMREDARFRALVD